MEKVKNFFKTYWITFLILIVTFILYDVATHNGWLQSALFPTPEVIWAAFMKNIDVMPVNFTASMSLLIPSLIIATVLALAIGILMGVNKRVRETLYPIIYAVSVIPALLLSPFALHLAPSFTAASIFLIIYATIWSTLFATITGIMTIDRRYLDNAKTLCLPAFKTLTKVMLPAAMPSILSGFVTALRSSFLILVFAEMYSAQFGMGYFVKRNADFALYDNTWAGFLFMIIVLVIVMQIFEVCKNRLLRWTIE